MNKSRKLVKTKLNYQQAIKVAANEAVNKLEEMFKRNWDNDETLNNGDIADSGDNFEDEIYND